MTGINQTNAIAFHLIIQGYIAIILDTSRERNGEVTISIRIDKARTCVLCKGDIQGAFQVVISTFRLKIIDIDIITTNTNIGIGRLTGQYDLRIFATSQSRNLHLNLLAYYKRAIGLFGHAIEIDSGIGCVTITSIRRFYINAGNTRNGWCDKHVVHGTFISPIATYCLTVNLQTASAIQATHVTVEIVYVVVYIFIMEGVDEMAPTRGSKCMVVSV